MKKLKLWLVFLLVNRFIISNAQPLTIQWQRCLGGTLGEAGREIKQTFDGGYMFCGEVVSNDGDVSGQHSNQLDGWVVKLDSGGNLDWQRCYGGIDGDFFHSLDITSAHGFIVAGVSTSVDGDLAGVYQPGGFDTEWILNCDSAGIINWQKCVGGTNEEIPNQVIQTKDNGSIAIGWTNSSDFDAIDRHDTDFCVCWDTWVVKLDSNGTKQWSKCYGSYGAEEGNSILQTEDSGFVLASWTDRNGGDVQGCHGDHDYWIVKINSTGTIVWQKCLGGTGDDTPFDISQTQDGGYIVTGYTTSNDFDVSGNHNNSEDVWIVKLDSIGNILWQKCYGGSWEDVGRKIIQLSDGGYLVLSHTDSPDGDLTNNPPATVDVWIMRLDPVGNIIWQQCLGGTNIDGAYDIQLTSDGGVVFTGLTASNDGDVSGNHGDYDVWVVKLAPLPDGIVTYVNAITDFSAYQNNTSHTLGLSFYCNGNENVSVQLLDLTGRVLLQQRLSVSIGFNKKQVQAGNISTGVYMVRLATDAGAVVKKLMVQ